MNLFTVPAEIKQYFQRNFHSIKELISNSDDNIRQYII